MKLSNWKENWEKSIHKPRSIRYHIGLIMIAFCVFVLMAIWLFQIVFLEDSYRNIKVKSIGDSAAQLTEKLAGWDITDQSTQYAMEEEIQEIARQSDACVLIRSDNSIISANTRIRSCVINKMSPSQLKELAFLVKINGSEMWSYLTDNELIINNSVQETFSGLRNRRTNGDNYLIYGNITYDQNGHESLILMSSSLDPVNVVQEALINQLWTIFAIILLFSLVLTVILSKFIGKPITNVTQQAQKLAEGDYTPNFKEQGYEEIAQLNDTLNYACDELSKVEGLRRELIANVSHDLRTPLTLISGYGEMMRDIPGENNAENVQVIIDEANRLSSMVNNLLDVSRLESQAETTNAENICITSLLKIAQERYQALLQSQGYTIELEQDQDVIVHADAVQMQQVLYNLLNNAVNYTGEDKKIWIKQSISGQKVRIDIIDDGDGVDPQQIKDIWSRYYRIDKQHKRAIVGNGLGLSIVKQVVEQNNGTCGVTSEIGKGSDFYFELPIVKEDK